MLQTRVRRIWSSETKSCLRRRLYSSWGAPRRWNKPPLLPSINPAWHTTRARDAGLNYIIQIVLHSIRWAHDRLHKHHLPCSQHTHTPPHYSESADRLGLVSINNKKPKSPPESENPHSMHNHPVVKKIGNSRHLKPVQNFSNIYWSSIRMTTQLIRFNQLQQNQFPETHLNLSKTS